MLSVTKDKILLHCLMEEVLRMGCNDFPGRSGCFIARRDRNSRGRGLRDKRQSSSGR